MSLEENDELSDCADDSGMNLDQLVDILRDVLAAPSAEGLALLVEAQLARSAPSGDGEPAQEGDGSALDTVPA